MRSMVTQRYEMCETDDPSYMLKTANNVVPSKRYRHTFSTSFFNSRVRIRSDVNPLWSNVYSQRRKIITFNVWECIVYAMLLYLLWVLEVTYHVVSWQPMWHLWTCHNFIIKYVTHVDKSILTFLAATSMCWKLNSNHSVGSLAPTSSIWYWRAGIYASLETNNADKWHLGIIFPGR